LEMRYKVYNGSEVIFTALADLPDVASPEILAEFERAARENFQMQYPTVDLADPRIRQEWEKERADPPK
jgi:hypothetical protein